MRKLAIIIALWVCCVVPSWAQSRMVSGVVTDAVTNQTLPGVTIRIKGTVSGATTDIDGRYQIEVHSDEAILIFSFIGYTAIEAPVTGQSSLDIMLQPEIQELEEVVVTALGIRREKKALGYAVQVVKGEALETNRDVSVINQLHGKVSGLQITETTGGPGSSSRIVLRGNTSLAGDNNALIVVDGMAINNNTENNTNEWGGMDFGSGISDINPDDIASVSVLKGAGAAALYGSRAANGVILITTKKGASKPTGWGITVNSGSSLVRPYILQDFQNVYGAGRDGQFQGPWEIKNGVPVYNTDSPFAFGSWGPAMEGQTIVDWDGVTRKFSARPDNYKNYFQTGYNLNNAFSVEQGGEQGSFRFSYANLSNRDIVPNTQLKRHNLNLTATSRISENFRIEAGVNYVNQKADNRLALSNAFSVPRNYVMMPRNISDASLAQHVMDEQGVERVWYTNWNWMSNPYWMHTYELNYDTRDRMLANAAAFIQLMPKLSLRIRGNSDIVWHRFHARQATNGRSNSLGSVSERWLNSKFYSGDILLSYQEKLSGDFNLVATAGGMIENRKHEMERVWTEDGLILPYFYNVDFGRVKRSDAYLSEQQINSAYATQQLSYRSILFLDLTQRIDGSSTLPKSNNTYFYPSASMGFVFTDALGIDEDWIQYGKLRASLARVGSAAEPYQLQKSYNQTVTYNGVPMTSLNEFVPNYDLKPEMSSSWEVGCDLRMLNNRLKLDASWYTTDTKNQILSSDISAASGTPRAIINTGEIKNRGIEVQISGAPLQSIKGVNWNLSLNMAHNESSVVNLAPGLENYVLLQHWRMTVEARPGNPYGDLVGYDVKRDGAGNKIIDSDGMYVRGDKPVVLGNVMPDMVGGLRSDLRYRNWTLGLLVDFSLGGELFSGTNMYGYGYSGNLKGSLKGREAWYASEEAREEAGMSSAEWNPTGGVLVEGVTPEGEAVSRYVNPEKYWGQYSAWGNEIHEPFVYDASFVKLRELSLTFRLPDRWVKPLHLSNAAFSFIGRNLWLIYSGAPNIDPEGYYTNGNGQGFELYAYPTRRSVGFNLKFNI